ncbi:unnamed protein product [Paramecium sonneborni]|uniref:Transmembrane protein n=1 Tax=Paramecium sonneborni TaxID=65129 RepID=A0A8S1RNX3_9CILI|nr:unnamed protein product [Paramecium sonneborni]
MTFIQGQIITWMFQMCLCFRSFQTQFNKEIFQRSCPSSHQYWPGIHPHMCAGVPRECGGTTELRQVIIGEKEIMCNPQIQGYVLYGNLDTHLLLGWYLYTFQMVTLEPSINFSTYQNVTIEIQQGGLLCQFNGTNKIQNYRKDSIINIQCRDLDTLFEWNDDQKIKIEVSCADLTMNSICKDANNKMIQVNKTDTSQIILKMTVKPYSIVVIINRYLKQIDIRIIVLIRKIYLQVKMFNKNYFSLWLFFKQSKKMNDTIYNQFYKIQAGTVEASKYDKSYQFKMNIVFLDNDFPILDVQYSKGYTIRPINNYETLQFDFNIPFENRYNLLQYQIAIIYNFELIKIFEPQYFKYKFRLFDYYQQFKMGNQFNLKFLAQFTNDIIPSQSDLQLTLNQPPFCTANLVSLNIQALKSYKIVVNCDQSDDSPFTYQLRFFLYDQDYKDFKNQLSDYSLILNNYQRSNSLELFLPQGQVLALIQVMDSRGSMAYLEQYINVTEKNQFNCSDFQYRNFNYKQQIILLLEVLINHYTLPDCARLSEQLLENTKSFLDSEDLNNQFLALQTIKIYKRQIIKNKNSPKRLLNEIEQRSCYDNKTKLIYIKNNEIQKYFLKDINNFQKDASKLKNQAQKLLMKQTNLKNQINQNDIFMDEQQYQLQESITNSLEAVILLIDDLFLKISQTSIKSSEDKVQILDLSEKLIKLIDYLSTYVSAQVQVNGKSFILNGQILKFQQAKISKNVFNIQEGIDKDLMDGLIAFIYKEQLDIYFNYLNTSSNHFSELKNILNHSFFEIEKNSYARTKLQNCLYQNVITNYDQIKNDYTVDMIQYPYCEGALLQLPAFNFQCVQYQNNGSIQQCNLLIQETNNHNQSIQISCQCSYLGVIFLTRYQNLSGNEQEFEQTQKIYEQIKDNCSPFLLFHGIYLVFSLFIYFELIKLEFPLIDVQHILTEASFSESNLLKKNTDKWFKFYSNNIKIYQQSIKFIHEITSLFYSDDQIIKKSYKFLKMSIFFSILIPLSFFETFFIKTVTLIIILILNYLTLLILRLILKICEAVYRFQGIFKVAIIVFFLLIHLISYIIFFYHYIQKDAKRIRINKCQSLQEVLFFQVMLFQTQQQFIQGLFFTHIL